MTNANDARKAHKILNDLFKGNMVLDEEREFLRRALPELPKQMTLEEIIAHVDDAWSVASVNDWGGNSYNPNISIEDWLTELHEQLKGLIDTHATVPALPAGMRLADHETYGRCVVSPGVDDDGTCKIFHLSTHAGDGSDCCWAPIDSLTFADGGTFRLSPPEFLETKADYTDVPEGTILTIDGLDTAWVKKFDGWVSTEVSRERSSKELGYVRRRVLRWGWGK